MRHTHIFLLLTLLLVAACGPMDDFSESPSFGCADGVVGALENQACSFAPDEDKDHCYQDAAVRSGNVDYCTRITEGSQPQQKCYMRIAARKNTPGYCDQLPEDGFGYTKWQCLYTVAVANDRPELCNSIKGSQKTMFATFDKEGCLDKLGTEFAEDVKDPAVNTQCKSDADCPRVCLGSQRVDRYCNKGEGICEATETYDCAQEIYTNPDYDYISQPFSCNPSTAQCSMNGAPVQQVLRDVQSGEVKRMLHQRQVLTEHLKKTGRTQEYYDEVQAALDKLDENIEVIQDDRRTWDEEGTDAYFEQLKQRKEEYIATIMLISDATLRQEIERDFEN